MIRIPMTAVYTTAVAAMAAGLLAAGEVRAQVLPPLEDPLNRTLEERLPTLEDRVRERARQGVDKVDETGESVTDAADETVGTATEAAGDAAEQAGEVVDRVTGTAAGTAGAVLRPFTVGADPYGRPIERAVLVVLVETAGLAAVTGFGLEVVAERELAGLGMTLVTLRAPRDAPLGRLADELRRAVPPAAVDYNHVFDLSAASATGRGIESGSAGEAGTGTAAPLRIGLVDSAVQPSHHALEGSRVVPRDFVTHEGERPLGHGTAVASLLAEASSGQADIYSASVFFALPGSQPGATTESLVAALDWLVTENVDAINMSLSGPPNALLERALSGIADDGPAVVAAVGNNGPAGAPMFPAAYAQVIGVTAVDRENRIYRRANRGGHVAFAAHGVNVKIADVDGGGYRVESGTSLASPFVAAVVAAERRGGLVGRAALMEALIAGAKDLGERGFDDVFGHGLLARRPAIASNLRTSPQD